MTTQTNGYVFTLTTFNEDSDRIATPLVLANAALANGNDVLLWLTMEGVKLAKAGSSENLTPKSFAPVKELLTSFIDNGGRIGICPPCGKTHGITDDNKLDNANWMGAVAMLEESAHCQSFSF